MDEVGSISFKYPSGELEGVRWNGGNFTGVDE